MPAVQIYMPLAKHKRRLALPESFFAFGLVRGKEVKSVRAVLTGTAQCGTNEIQTVTVTNATGGTFTLTYAGQTTGNINWNAPAQGAQSVQAALVALSNIGTGNVTCAGGQLGTAPVTVTFQNDLANTNVPQMTADGTNLLGTGATVTVATTTPGSGKSKLVRFVTQPIAGKPGQFRYSWLFHFANVTTSSTPVDLTLKVFAVDRDGADIEDANDQVKFQARFRARAVPEITYPAPDYDIEGGERDYFMPFGLSSVAMSGVSLGGVAALFTGYDPDTGMWYSVFPSLTQTPGPGDYSLVTTNAEGDRVQPVTIADH